MHSDTGSSLNATSPIAAADAERPDFDAVPLIDLSGMRSGNTSDKARLAAELRDALHQRGFLLY